jgi:nitroreductase
MQYDPRVSSSRPDAAGMDLFEAMRRRRMHRMFTDEPVARERLDTMVYAAGRAQAVRADIRHLVVVDDPRLVRTIRQVCPGFVNNAPALIAVCSDLQRAEELVGTRGVEVVARLDAGGAAGYLALAAPALGLGICVVTSWTESAVQAVLGLPDRVRPEVLVAVGHPVPDPPRAVRRFEPVVSHNRHGTPWNEEVA